MRKNICYFPSAFEYICQCKMKGKTVMVNNSTNISSQLKQLNTNMTMTYVVGNSGSGLRQSQAASTSFIVFCLI